MHYQRQIDRLWLSVRCAPDKQRSAEITQNRWQCDGEIIEAEREQKVYMHAYFCIYAGWEKIAKEPNARTFANAAK